MQGASLTSARVEITEDQAARAPVGRIEMDAGARRCGMAIRRIKFWLLLLTL